MPFWSVPPLWRGETAFVLAGGPSVLSLDLSLLAGRKVIAINSAWKTYPQADVLFFADGRWWKQFKPAFTGMIVTTASEIGLPGIHVMEKVQPKEGLALARTKIALRRTSVTGAINLAVHFGCDRIVLLGVDGGFLNGVRHNHDDRYPWPMVNGCWDEHAAEFGQIAPSAKALGISILNASPESRIDVWPKVSFAEAIRQ